MKTLPPKSDWKPVARFLINCLGGTPVVGGVFGALSAAWSESEQAKINQSLELKVNCLAQEVAEAAQKMQAELEEENRALFASGKNPQWVVAYIKLNPNTMRILESSGISSIGDNGALDCTVSFSKAIGGKFSMQAFGDGPVQFDRVELTQHAAHIRFASPCPDTATLIFFNL